MPFGGILRRTRTALARSTQGTEAQPELTLPAILIGLAIGCLLCFTNLYFGLQTGWISMMSLQSALIGFLVSRLLPSALIATTPQTTVIIQTTAVATGTMPLAAGFVGILPALGLLNEAQDGRAPVNLGWWATAGWCTAVAYFGVFLSPPLRKQVIVREKLAFPSGTATAQLIKVLHGVPTAGGDGPPRRRRGYVAIEDPSPSPATPGYTGIPHSSLDDEADDSGPATSGPSAQEAAKLRQTGWPALLYSFAASFALTTAAYFFPAIFAIPLFGQVAAKEWAWTFTPSLSYVGQGIIMGFPTTLSMAFGAVVGWGVLGPMAKNKGWAPGKVGSMTDGARGWILWISLGIMVADSVVGLMPVVVGYVQSRIGGKGDGEEGEEEETEEEERLVPSTWVKWGLGISVLAGVILIYLVFGEPPWATFIGFIAGSLLAILGVRALGETDLNPVSGLGKISQLLFAILQPGNVLANVVAGGVAEAGAQQAGDLMQDLKTGHLVGASPRAQFWGQMIGSAASIVVSTTAYRVYQNVYEIPGPSFPAPTAYVWLSLARLLRDGQLPPKSKEFMLGFALLFGALSALKTHGLQRNAVWASYLPSGVAFAIGFLNTPSFALARLVGGTIEYLWRKRMERLSRTGEIGLIIVASGFVLGEGVASVVGLALKTWGVGVASCWGCGTGMCAGCSA